MTNNPMDTACPELLFDGIDTNFNTLITTPEGWKFWDHQTPQWPDGRPGNIERVQFCRRIGRKKDVFECINVREWHACPHSPKNPRPHDLCDTCEHAVGLAPGEECHPPNDSDCPANKIGCPAVPDGNV